MSDAPDFIWACDDAKGECRVCFTSTSLNYSTPYIRRDPAVLAALPEVQQMVAAAVMEAAEEADKWVAPLTGHRMRKAIRALIPADAMAALEAYRDREVAKALEGAEKVAGDAAVAVLLRQEPNASPLKVQMTRQAVAKPIRAMIPEVKP